MSTRAYNRFMAAASVVMFGGMVLVGIILVRILWQLFV